MYNGMIPTAKLVGSPKVFGCMCNGSEVWAPDVLLLLFECLGTDAVEKVKWLMIQVFACQAV